MVLMVWEGALNLPFQIINTRLARLSLPNCLVKTEHDEHVRQSEKKFCSAMQPIHIG